MMRAVGEMPEWPNGTDSKSVVLATVPRVRIPISPPLLKSPYNSIGYKGFGKAILYQRFVPKNSPDLRIGAFFCLIFDLTVVDQLIPDTVLRFLRFLPEPTHR